MTMIAIVPFLVCVVGCVLYALATSPKLSEIGRLAFLRGPLRDARCFRSTRSQDRCAMTPTNLLLLLTTLSFVLVSISHSLSDDGAASILNHFGILYRFPTWIVYAAVLFCTAGSAGVDNVVAGNDWQHAAIVAFGAFAASVFGAVKTQSAAAVKAVALIVGTGALVVTLQACAAFQSVVPFLPTSDQLACVEVEADKATPALMIITKCGLAQDALSFVENFLVGHKRAKAIRADAQRAALFSDGGAK